MEQIIRQIGNSAGMFIPSALLKKLGLKIGTKIVIQENSDGSFTVSKKGAKRIVSSITPEFIKLLEGVNRRYGADLKKLAQQK